MILIYHDNVSNFFNTKNGNNYLLRNYFMIDNFKKSLIL